MKPAIGQIWKFTNINKYRTIVEYHLLVRYKPKFDRWILYNVQTGEEDFDFEDQFQMDDRWTFIQ